MAVAVAWVALGSNLGDRRASIDAALRALDAGPGHSVAAVSRVDETDPVDLLDQPRFLNAVAQVETTLEPRPLLDRLLAIERELGRTRDGPRFGPRTIDLDLLLYDERVVDEPDLRVPHPRLHERRFLLELLLDAGAGAAVIPAHGRVEDVLAELH